MTVDIYTQIFMACGKMTLLVLTQLWMYGVLSITGNLILEI